MTEHRMRQTSGVPRGLLQFLVLKLLAEKAMSGVEIVEDIEQETRGFWKPSSGSLYPLLARLQKKGYTSESPTGEGMKRYILTDEGEAFFKKQVKLGQNFLKKLEYLVPILIGGFHYHTNNRHLNVVRESAKRLVQVFIDARTTIQDKLTQQDAEKINHLLNDCADQLEEIFQRIKDKENA